MVRVTIRSSSSGLCTSKGSAAILLLPLAILVGCRGIGTGDFEAGLFNPPPPATNSAGVFMWKGDNTAKGLYSNEIMLTPTNVNPAQFGMLGRFTADGILMAQPLYVSNLNMGSGGTHDVIIIVTENDSVYALDAEYPGAAPLWQRSFINPNKGITPLPDNFGGRTTLGPNAGITGTPIIDQTTNAMYFVTADSNNGAAEQWFRAIDIRTGNDFGPRSTKVDVSVPGDGSASTNGRIAFDASIQNQRMGLVEVNRKIIVAWGSFSDRGLYHGWVMAFDAATLALQAVFNSATEYQDDPDKGGGVGFWAGGAAPAVDSGGNIYFEGANGSFDADQGGNNYGDTLLKLQLTGSTFQVMDTFTPSDANCIDHDDLELGSGSIALLPTDFTNGNQFAATTSKEGRLYLIDINNLGGYNVAGDTQIPQEFMVGEVSCSTTTTPVAADGPTWDRLYGNPSYWNGNLYAAAANIPLKQYQFKGGLLSPTPVAESPSSYGYRGGNTVVSSNGIQNAIVWAYEKQVSGIGLLHAYDANSVINEIWNTQMNPTRDGLGEGINFSTPVVVDGRVITTYDSTVAIFGLLN
jgi:hypothetical protein